MIDTHFRLRPIRTTLGWLTLAACLAHSGSASAAGIALRSRHAIVVDDTTGAPLLEKGASSVVPIASLTKLMTAMVVLDANQDMEEHVDITASDVDVIKHSSSRVPVGASLPRKTLLHLALMSSDNRAAASLARTYPGGRATFAAAVRAKLKALGMNHTRLGEPTGLSPQNTSTARDLALMASAAADYPDIVRITTDPGEHFEVNGYPVAYHNTNALVGKNGWHILLSKTGYTKEAGRCLIMRLRSGARSALVVLLDANGSAARSSDAAAIRSFLAGDPVLAAHPTTLLRRQAHHAHRTRRTAHPARLT